MEVMISMAIVEQQLLRTEDILTTETIVLMVEDTAEAMVGMEVMEIMEVMEHMEGIMRLLASS